MRKPVAPPSALLGLKNLVIHSRRLLRRPTSLPAPTRYLAQIRPEPLTELWFTSSFPSRSPADDLLRSPGGPHGDHKPPDERTLRLGKTLRVLSPLLPEILHKSLPQELLSPSISLHLFPSTHPHLPSVKGRVSYQAALWTAPVAWGCVPILGNTKIEVLSEKIVRTGFIAHEDDKNDLAEEKLVVRWKTKPKSNSTDTNAATAANSSSVTNGGVNRGLSTLLGGDKPIFNLNKGDDFSGMFIFSFDSKGRIATHTIEHADENSGYDRTNRVVMLTDWLLGKAKLGSRKQEELIPGLAMRVCRDEWLRSSGKVRPYKSGRLW